MTEKLPHGEAYRKANKNRDVRRATSKSQKAREAEWVGDSEFTRDELIAKQRSMRAECAMRHPEWFA
jgi:hypothetical protein